MAGGKVTIELDTAVVQKAVAARVQPAVDRIMDGVDLPARIVEALLEKPKRSDEDHFGFPFLRSYTERRAPIDIYIDNEIANAAQAFVKKSIAKQAPKIEAAFKKMMAESNSKLAHTLLNSLNDALASEWSFTLDTRIDTKHRD